MQTGEKSMLGIYKDLSIEDYHADKTAISRSGLMEFKKSPYHYWANYLNPDKPEKEPTDAMILGNAFHTLVLEPNTFDERYLVMPEKVLLKDVGREAYDKYKATIDDIENNNAGFTVLTKKQMDMLTAMYESLKIERHKQAYELIAGAEYEK
jgi:exodeoxyribonuclease VIII